MKRAIAHALPALIGAAGLFVLSVAGAAAATRPNFILILSDDQTSSTLRFMPNVDRLNEAGVRFTNFFATNPVCGPARTSLLTGRYPHNHGVRDNLGPDGGIHAFRDHGHELSNLATWLQAGGYRTGLVGKYMNGYGVSDATTYAPEGWSTWCAKLDQGVGYFDFSVLCKGDVTTYEKTQGIHELDVLGDAAAQFIDDAVEAKEPFFLYFAPFSPHANNKEDPPEPPAAFDGIYEGIGAPRGPAYNEADVSDKPPWLKKQPLIDEARAAQIDLLYSKTAEAVAGLDAAIGALLDVVADQDIEASTYVMFVSDHGYAFGEHRLLRKGTAYEECVRIPLVMTGPGVPGGETREELVANTDIAPTILELAGVTAASEIDGRSFVPLIEGGAPSWRQAILLENYRMVDPPNDLSAVFNWRSLRTESYKLTEYDGPDESYDLDADPFELASLLAPPSITPPAENAAWLEQLACCRGATCRARENDGPLPGCELGDEECACAAATVCADATEDDRISVADAQRILVSVAAGDACTPCRCDIDGDGDVSVRDALAALIAAVRGATNLSCPAC